MILLPSQKFFVPRPKFGPWILGRFDISHVYDVGAGLGHVSVFLASIGLGVTALDINQREDTEYRVLHEDGASYPYCSGSVVLLARPCHGTFVESVIHQAWKRCAHVVYVGLGKNLDRDLGDYRKLFSLGLRNCGSDRENAWVREDT